MRVHVQSILPASPDAIWAAVQRTDTLARVARPLFVFRAGRGAVLPERWPVGVPVPMRLRAFGLIPVGPHTLLVESVDDAAMTVQTRESSPLMRRWDHRITVAPAAHGRALYTDTVEIEAGLLTPAVAAVARLFFHHRHRRWQALARRLARGTAAS